MNATSCTSSRGSGEKIFKKSVFKVKEGREEFEVELEDIAGLAVDASGRLWVYWGEEGSLSAFSAEEHEQAAAGARAKGSARPARARRSVCGE